jgi:hypothetical protein
MEPGGCRSREIVRRFSGFSVAGRRWRMSNRHFLVRFENVATCRKQKVQVHPNRHISEGGAAQRGGSEGEKL